MGKPVAVATLNHAAGQFHVYPVDTIDQGIEILTGVAAGASNEQGEYPAGTVNRRVADRLADFAQQRRAYVQGESAVPDGI